MSPSCCSYSGLGRPRPRLARPFYTERVPPCRSLLAVKQAPEPRLVGRSDATTRRRPEMRAETKKKQKMGRRFAILIGLAAVGVMALGAQTAFAAPTYNTRLTISEGRAHSIGGGVYSGGGRRCQLGRRVTLFKQEPGADRKIIDVRSGGGGPKTGPRGTWGLGVPKVRFLSRMGGAYMPRRRPRWAMGSCAAPAARRSTRSGNPPSKPPDCGSRAWRLGASQAPRFLGSVLQVTVPLRPPKTPRPIRAVLPPPGARYCVGRKRRVMPLRNVSRNVSRNEQIRETQGDLR